MASGVSGTSRASSSLASPRTATARSSVRASKSGGSPNAPETRTSTLRLWAARASTVFSPAGSLVRKTRRPSGMSPSATSGPSHTSRSPFPASLHVPRAPADLSPALASALDEEPVAAGDGDRGVQDEPALRALLAYALADPDLEAAVVAGAGLDEPLMVDAGEETGTRAAREHLEGGARSSWSGAGPELERRVDGPPVERGRGRDVLPGP